MNENIVSVNNAQPYQPPLDSVATRTFHVAANGSTVIEPAAAIVTGKPSLHGPAPRGLERRFVSATPGVMPEFCKLPSPKERCPFTGASRSWLIDQAEAGHIKLVRVRQPGKMRGAVFVHVPTLLAFLRRQMEEQREPTV